MSKIIKGLSYQLFALPDPIPDFIGSYAVDLLLRLSSIRMRLNFSIRDDHLTHWKRQTHVFFVLGMARSGTKFLSNLLDRIPETHVAHEPTALDFAAYIRAYHDQGEANSFVHNYRQKEIYARVKSMHISHYGEVNSVLRRHIEPLKLAFPEATFIHLVRDGRDVVRSMMSRDLFRSTHPVTRLLEPAKRDPWTEQWRRMNRFERLCWFWATENRFVRERIQRTIQFEKIIADYSYFDENVLQPLQLNLSETQWRRAIARPKNETNQHTIPHWSEWNSARRESFTQICGDEMTASGYELDWRGTGT